MAWHGFTRCDNSYVFASKLGQGSFVLPKEWRIGRGAGGYNGVFETAQAAMEFVDQVHPVTKCGCKDWEILLAEMEQALEEK